MSKRQQLNEWYEQILTALSAKQDSDHKIGMVWIDDGEESFFPVKAKVEVNGELVTKPIFFPDKAITTKSVADIIVFHPLSESLARGESEVFKAIVKMAEFRIQAQFNVLFNVISDLIAYEDKRKDMAAGLKDILNDIPKPPSGWKTFVKDIPAEWQAGYARLHSNRKKKIGDGEEYRRTCRLTFPLRAALETRKRDVMGYHISGAKWEEIIDTAKGILDYIIGDDYDDVQKWSTGSNSDTAPYLVSMLNIYAIISERMNQMVHKFRKYIPDYQQLKVDLEYMEQLDDIKTLKTALNSMSGNIGISSHTPAGDDDSDEPKIRDRHDTPPWEDEPEDDKVESKPTPGKKSFSGYSSSSNNRDRDNDRDRRRDDRDRGRDRRRDDRSRDRDRGNRNGGRGIYDVGRDRDDRGRSRDRDDRSRGRDRDDRSRGRDRDRRGRSSRSFYDS